MLDLDSVAFFDEMTQFHSGASTMPTLIFELLEIDLYPLFHEKDLR